MLLSNIPEAGTPLVILGDYNIHLDKPQAADFHTLLASFDLKRVLTMVPHKSGNQLDLIYTHNTAPLIMYWLLHCKPRITSSSFLTSTWFLTQHIPLHMPSFNVTYAHTHPPGYLLWFHLRFQPLNSYLSLDANSVTDTFCSTPTSCLDTVCPLSSRPAHSPLPHLAV